MTKKTKMPRSSAITWKGVFQAIFGIYCTIFALEVLGVIPDYRSVLEKIWTADDLSSMAHSSTMTAAVSHLMRARESREHALQLDEIEKLIDLSTAASLRTAILSVTDGSITDRFANFARTTSAAATCTTEGAAGRHGLDPCLADCEEKRSFLARTPRKGACYMLCSLANSPCTNALSQGTTPRRSVSWGTKKPNWWAPLNIWVVLVVKWMASKLDTSSLIAWAMKLITRETVGLLAVACCAYKVRERRKVAQRKEGRRKLDQIFETHEKLVNQDGPYSLKEDLSSWRIGRDSAKGGQR